MRIDCYGRETAHGGLPPGDPPPPAEKKHRLGITYLRYGFGDGKCPVHRIVAADDGRIVHEWAWGKWVDRSRLAYVGIDETIELGGMP